MTDREINDFVINHSGKQWFDMDLVLYKQKFPHSKILKDLENAPDFRKSQLDERMVAELLRDGGQCTDCIWEARGYMRDKDGFIVLMQQSGALNEFETQLLQIDLDAKPNYNTLKAIVFGLGLETADNKIKTYIDILKAVKEEIINRTIPIVESAITDNTVTSTDASPIDVNIIENPEKKSEGQESNTQQ